MVLARVGETSYSNIAVSNRLDLEHSALLGDLVEGVIQRFQKSEYLNKPDKKRLLETIGNVVQLHEEYTLLTCVGSRTELHAVKPTMSANNTVCQRSKTT